MVTMGPKTLDLANASKPTSYESYVIYEAIMDT